MLRSVFDRMFGTSESKSLTEAGWDGRSTRLAYERYPALPALLLKMLEVTVQKQEIQDSDAEWKVSGDRGDLGQCIQVGQDSNGVQESVALSIEIGAVQSVFPAMDLVRRAGPPEELRDKILERIMVHLGSTAWEVRQVVSRAVTAFLLQDEWLEAILTLLKSCGQSTNRYHGVLMSVQDLLERRLELFPDTASGRL